MHVDIRVVTSVGEHKMRQTAIVATSVIALAGVSALGGIWGVTVISAKSPTQASTPVLASSVNVMQMMKDAKNLPVQQYDAF
jgi:hypothetical protein